jgi:hypothetical protein
MDGTTISMLRQLPPLVDGQRRRPPGAVVTDTEQIGLLFQLLRCPELYPAKRVWQACGANSIGSASPLSRYLKTNCLPSWHSYQPVTRKSLAGYLYLVQSKGFSYDPAYSHNLSCYARARSDHSLIVRHRQGFFGTTGTPEVEEVFTETLARTPTPLTGGM